MTKPKKYRRRKTTLIVVMSRKGGVRKTTTVAYLADILRASTTHSVGILDGDLKIHGTFQRFATKDENGEILDNQSLTAGAWITDLREVKGRAKILEAIEESPDFVIVDSAGGADDNFGDIFGEGFSPADFMETLDDLDTGLVFVSPVLPDDDDTIRSIKSLSESFKDLPVFYIAALSSWGATSGERDPRFSMWDGSKTRERLVDDGDFAEVLINHLPDEVMSKVREVQLPISELLDTTIAKSKGIDLWTRTSIKKVRESIRAQLIANPKLKDLFGV